MGFLCHFLAKEFPAVALQAHHDAFFPPSTIVSRLGLSPLSVSPQGMNASSARHSRQKNKQTQRPRHGGQFYFLCSREHRHHSANGLFRQSLCRFAITQWRQRTATGHITSSTAIDRSRNDSRCSMGWRRAQSGQQICNRTRLRGEPGGEWMRQRASREYYHHYMAFAFATMVHRCRPD